MNTGIQKQEQRESGHLIAAGGGLSSFQQAGREQDARPPTRTGLYYEAALAKLCWLGA